MIVNIVGTTFNSGLETSKTYVIQIICNLPKIWSDAETTEGTNSSNSKQCEFCNLAHTKTKGYVK